MNGVCSLHEILATPPRVDTIPDDCEKFSPQALGCTSTTVTSTHGYLDG